MFPLHCTTRTILALLLALAVLLPGCATPASTAGSSPTGAPLRGTITISGAWALYPLVVKWTEEFHALHPGVEFDVSAGGAGKGMADALGGAVDLGMVSRAIHPTEVEQGAFGIAVTMDAVVPTCNSANPHLSRLRQQGLSQQTLARLWQGEIATWGELLGDPSVTDEVHVYTRSDACGAAETWALYLGDLTQEDLQGVAVYGDPGLATAVAEDPLGVGYNNLNFAYDADSGQPVAGLQILPLDVDGDGALDADEDWYANKATLMAAIANAQYPRPPARALFIVTKGAPSGIGATFLRWCLTDGQQYVEPTGFVPLAPDQITAELERLEAGE